MENFIFCVVLLSDIELLKKMFYTISDMGKTNRAQFFLFEILRKIEWPLLISMLR